MTKNEKYKKRLEKHRQERVNAIRRGLVREHLRVERERKELRARTKAAKDKKDHLEQGDATKQCNQCGNHKRMREYYPIPTCVDGYSAKCKKCIAENNAVRYAKNREKVDARAKAWRQEAMRIQNAHIDNKLEQVLKREEKQRRKYDDNGRIID